MAETPRVGPLSYSVEASDGDVSAERPILLGGIVAIVLAVPATVLGWFALGVLSARTLVVLAASAAGPAIGMLVAYRSSTGRRRRRRNALIGTGAVGLFVIVVSYNLLGIVRPALPELRAAIDDVRVPPGFVLVSEAESGARLCDPKCPELARIYRADGVEDPAKEFLRAMFRQGWNPADQNLPPDSNTAAVRGRIHVDVFFTTGEPTIRVVVSGSAGKGYIGGDG